MHFSTPYKYDPADVGCYEVLSDEPSMTVPDQSLTVRDLLERYTRGIAPACAREPLYDDRENLDFEDVDPSERPDFDLVDVDLHRRNLEALSEKVSAEVKAAKKKKDEKEQPPPATAPVSETTKA